jgi:hypothetical protein
VKNYNLGPEESGAGARPASLPSKTEGSEKCRLALGNNSSYIVSHGAVPAKSPGETGDSMFIKCLAGAVFALALSAIGAVAQCQSNAQLSCQVYNSCFDKYCPCENTPYGYFIRYGKKYCNRFLASSGWSEKGNNWRNRTLLCLQERIVPNLPITEHPACDCRSMKDFAFKTHVECYTQPGASVCNLDLADYKKIYDIIDVRDDLFSDPYGRKQMRDVLAICKDDPKSTLSPDIIKLIIKIIDKLDHA